LLEDGEPTVIVCFSGHCRLESLSNRGSVCDQVIVTVFCGAAGKILFKSIWL